MFESDNFIHVMWCLILSITVPTAHPSNITAARSTEDSITVTWHPLTLIKARGFVTHYTVRYAKAVNSCDYTYDSNETITQDSNIVLNAVAIDSVYCVSVSAVTVGGNGPLSTPPVMVPCKCSQHTLYIAMVF